MTHYACPTCGEKSDIPKVCETEGCMRQGQMMKACNCLDDKHEEVKDATANEGM